jgi:hypothetical protein
MAIFWQAADRTVAFWMQLAMLRMGLDPVASGKTCQVAEPALLPQLVLGLPAVGLLLLMLTACPDATAPVHPPLLLLPLLLG